MYVVRMCTFSIPAFDWLHQVFGMQILYTCMLSTLAPHEHCSCVNCLSLHVPQTCALILYITARLGHDFHFIMIYMHTLCALH